MPTSASSDQDSGASADDVLERFELAWQRGAPPRIESYLPAERPWSGPILELLGELVAVDLEYRWRRPRPAAGPDRDDITRLDPTPIPDQPRLEDYARQFPELGSWQQFHAELIGEEYRVRSRWGDRPRHSEYVTRFPGRGLAEVLKAIDSQLSTQVSPRQAAAPVGPAIDAGGTRRSDEPAPLVVARPERLTAPVANDNDAFDGTSTACSEPSGVTPKEPGVAQGAASRLPAQIGRYKIRAELGTGGYGRVYLAFDEELDRQVAIKVPHPDRFHSAQEVQSFYREARLAAQLRHASLVQVYDVERDAAAGCYIVMEYVPGGTLAEALRRGNVPLEGAVRWTAAIAEAVHCAHKVGLVHGDLKPGNILIDAEGMPRVADFGLAVRESEQRANAGDVAGTPAYMAPEQVRGEMHRLDGRADLWSIGVMLYEILTGRKPFRGDNLADLFDEILHREPKPPRQIDDRVPSELEAICLKCLSKRVIDRYTTGRDLALDLAEAMGEGGLSASRGGADRSAPPRHSSPWHASPWQIGSQRSARASASHASASRRHAGPSNLPAQVDRFIGRQRELAELTTMLSAGPAPASEMEASDARLVTLTGPGGMGKTRLAMRTAEELLSSFPGGCWFAALAAARSAAEISHAVSEALGVPASGSEVTPQAVADILEFRKPLLLLLDNFEQAADQAAETVGLWLRLCPHVHFLATSRSALGLAGEQEYELLPLPVPPLDPLGTVLGARPAPEGAHPAAQYESVQLFLDRARRADFRFVFDERAAADAAAICATLEGFPLAIELAAARVKHFTPAQLAEKLGQKFDLLQSARRDLPPRQKTLWGAILWSYELLDECERQAFLQASIFRDGFFIEASQAVIDLAGCTAPRPVAEVVQSLRDKNLLTSQRSELGTRYGMYVSLREFGEEQWRREAAAERQNALEQRFAEYYISAAEAWNRAIHFRDGAQALERLQRETENLFAVQDKASAAGDAESAARAIAALAEPLSLRGQLSQRLPRLERAVAGLAATGRPDLRPVQQPDRPSLLRPVQQPDRPSLLWVELLIAASEACQDAGAVERSVVLVEQALCAAKLLGTGLEARILEASAYYRQGDLRRRRGELNGAEESFAQSELLALEAGDARGRARARRARHGGLAARRLRTSHVMLFRGGNPALRAGRLVRIVVDRPSPRPRALAAGRPSRRATLLRRGGGPGPRAGRRPLRAFGARQPRHGAGRSGRFRRRDRLLRRCGSDRAPIGRQARPGHPLRQSGGAPGRPGRRHRGPGLLRPGRNAQPRPRQQVRHSRQRGQSGQRLGRHRRLSGRAGRLRRGRAAQPRNGKQVPAGTQFGRPGHRASRQGRHADARDGLQAGLALLDQIGSSRSPEYFGFQTLLASVEQALGNREAAASVAASAQALAAQLELTESHPKRRVRDGLTVIAKILMGT